MIYAVDRLIEAVSPAVSVLTCHICVLVVSQHHTQFAVQVPRILLSKFYSPVSACLLSLTHRHMFLFFVSLEVKVA